MSDVKKILIVDDEEYNLDILDECLKDTGFETILARNGLEAISKLESHYPIDVIVLDRMMPILDGIGFVRTIKGIDKYKEIPVIMQTAADTSEQVLEGIAAGVFYYLTKPYEKTTLLTILNSALEHHVKNRKTVDEVLTHNAALQMLEHGVYRFSTLEDAKYLSFAISNIFPKPDKALFGLHELCINAVEHGNLGIGFEGKKKLIKENKWLEEIDSRLQNDTNVSKFATLRVDVFPDRYEVRIKDTGNGFDHEEFMKFEPARLTSPNGRGIAMSKMYSFDKMEYIGNGSEVLCTIKK